MDVVNDFLLTNFRPILLEYFREFANRYPTDDLQRWVISEYSRQLLQNGITSTGPVKKGMDLIRKRKFRPNPEEFAKLCKPTAEELGLPSFEDAYRELVDRRCKHRFDEIEFSHRMIDVIDQRIGYRVRFLEESEFRDLFKGEYDYWLGRYLNGDQPEPRKAISYIPKTKPRIDDYIEQHGPSALGNDHVSKKIRELGLLMTGKVKEA